MKQYTDKQKMERLHLSELEQLLSHQIVISVIAL